MRVGFGGLQTTLPSITGAVLEIPAQEVQNFSGLSSILVTQLTESILNSVIAQWLSLIGRVDATALVGAVTSLSILPGIEGTLRSVANGLRGTVATGQRSAGINRSASGTFLDGFTNLVDSVQDGVTGLFTKPIAETRRNGATGFLMGFGSGVVGAIAKPVSGLLDATAGVVSGARKLVQGCEVVEPVRIPRVLLLNRITPFDSATAIAQKTFQSLEGKAMEQIISSFPYQDENGKGHAAVTTHFLAWFDNSSAVRRFIELARICEVTAHGAVIVISLMQGSSKRQIELDVQSRKNAVTQQRVLAFQRIVAQITS
jgi:vacuolar protein sorting-associated protein 13A/C